MASEDHDFEEIKSFQTKNKKFEISCNYKNFCTGRIKPIGLNKIISELEFYFQNLLNRLNIQFYVLLRM